MRLLLVSDLHYRLPHLDWVASVADRFDAVVLAGDHVDIASPVGAEVQIAALRVAFGDLATRCRLVVCSGNHDLNTRNASGEKAADWLAPLRADGVVVDGDTVTIGDTVVTVLGWWDGPVARAELEAQLEAVAPGDRRWVWVYHSPPQGPLAWTGSRHFGDPVVAEWIDRWRPAAVLMGHIHQAPFTPDGAWIDRVGTTWLFNPGKQIGPVPSHVELDLDAGTARWVSYERVDERRLDGSSGQ
jgi:Icc-related predicted phosphoesterase